MEPRYYTDVPTSPTPTSRAARTSTRSLWGSIALAFACLAVFASGATAAPRVVPKVPRLFPMELRASVTLGALPSGVPVTDGQRIYVPVRPSGFVAVALKDGEELWRSEARVLRGPVYAEGRLFVTTADTLEAIDPKDGGAVWRTPISAPAVAAPIISGDLVLVPLESGDVVAAKQGDGSLAWKLAVGGRPTGAVLSLGDTFVAALENGVIVGLTRATGAKKWEQTLGGHVSGLSGQGNAIYAGSHDNFFYGLDASNGRIKWRWRTGADVIGNATIDEERVYFVSMDNMIRALDRDTGVQRWKKPLAARPVVGPMAVGDLVLLSSLSPELRAVASDTGEAAGRYDLGVELGAPPVLAPGSWAGADLLVAVTADGTMLMLGRRLAPGMTPIAALPGTSTPVTVTPPTPPAPPPG